MSSPGTGTLEKTKHSSCYLKTLPNSFHYNMLIGKQVKNVIFDSRFSDAFSKNLFNRQILYRVT